MIKSALGKVMWVGRATVFLVGLAVILALVVGVASTAFGANGGNFILGSLNNTATAITKLTGTVGGNPALRVSNPSTATGSTALDLQVATGKAPMKVNSQTKVTNLNADKLDGQDSTEIGRELWVVMNENGGVVRGRGVIVASSRRLNTGSYLLTFDRDISNCAYVGSTDKNWDALVLPTQGANLGEVHVFTRALIGGNWTSLDVPFYLIVAC